MNFADICLINLINFVIFNQSFPVINRINYCNYTGRIWPQGFYKIAIWDRHIYPISVECRQIFVELQKEVKNNKKIIKNNKTKIK